MAKRKQPKTKTDEIPDSIFDALNLHSPGTGAGGEGEGKTAKAKEPTVAELLSQIEGLNKRIEEQAPPNLAILAPAPRIDNTPKEPTFNLDGLPDPLEDKDGYAKELASRQKKYSDDLTSYHNTLSNQQQEKSGFADQLWQDFATTYGDYAEDMEGVGFATQLAIKQAKRRGIDVDKYMYQHSDRFFKDVVSAYDKRFGKPEGEEAEDEPAERPAPKRKTVRPEPDDEADEGRTGGIFGGIDGSGSGRKAAGPQPGDMIKDLQDMQRKTGYY